MKAAIDAVPYASAVKFGLQFSRRFWEEDEHIFGGITYTIFRSARLPIRARISTRAARACCLGATLRRTELLGLPRWRRPRECAARLNSAPRSTRNIGPSSKTAFQSPGTGSPSRSVRGRLVGRSAKRALQRSLPDRRPHRVGRRTCLLHSAVAGGATCRRWTRSSVCTSGSSRHELLHQPRWGSRRNRHAMRNGIEHSPWRSSRRGSLLRRSWPTSSVDHPAMSRGRECAEQGGGDLFKILRRLPSARRERRGRRRRIFRRSPRMKTGVYRFLADPAAWTD